MDIVVPKIALEELTERYEEFENFYRSWGDKFEEIRINRAILSKNMIRDLTFWLEANKDRDKVVMKCLRKLDSFNKAMSEADTKELKRLVDVPATVTGYVLNNMPNQLVYKDIDGVMIPFIVTSVKYEPAKVDYPAKASIYMHYSKHGKVGSSSIYLNSEDLRGGKTVFEIFESNGYSIESEEFNKEWEKSLQYYSELVSKVGEVYVGSGKGTVNRDRYSSNTYYFKKDQQNKVVVDFKGFYEEFEDGKFSGKEQFKQSEIIGKSVKVPIHPYGHVFHLEDHIWIDVHVDNLVPYEFKGQELLKKLILPTQDKELIKILIEMSKMDISDIIEGKTGGSFIMSTGIPGTGKTLTAEVFSETVEKPLYKVQCSQLGINVETVEKKLGGVLKRASRWGAILLIDEADVYVRARKEDINQNAIVGVFLRTLEYYSGILFMTSNMETAIDDAIMSRATAHLVYSSPKKEEQRQIWKVLGDQFEVGLTDNQYDELVELFPNLVGRDIKSLLKLALMFSKGKGVEVSVSIFELIYRFVPGVNKVK